MAEVDTNISPKCLNFVMSLLPWVVNVLPVIGDLWSTGKTGRFESDVKIILLHFTDHPFVDQDMMKRSPIFFNCFFV